MRLMTEEKDSGSCQTRLSSSGSGFVVELNSLYAPPLKKEELVSVVVAGVGGTDDVVEVAMVPDLIVDIPSSSLL